MARVSESYDPETGLFVKICKDPRCRNIFKSRARNAAFCCKECQERYYKERKKRRKNYTELAEENRLASRAYALANSIADIFYPNHVCEVCGGESTQVHHKDVNPLNNDPSNLMRVCEKCHNQIHSTLPNINLPVTLHECKTLVKENDKVNIITMWESKFNRGTEDE